MKDVVISGSGFYVPPNLVTNEALVDAFNQDVDRYNQQHAAQIDAGELEARKHSSAAFIEKASGIKSRYIVSSEGVLDPERLQPSVVKTEGELSPIMTMALESAKKALAQANKSGSDIDLVIVAATNAERSYPASSIELQHLLGTKGFAFDMNVACSSATFALSQAVNTIRGGMARCVLIVCPEYFTPQLNYRDMQSHFIFGDAGAAMVVEAKETATSDNCWQVQGMKLLTQYSTNIRCDASYASHCYADDAPENPHFRQNGSQVFKELVPMVAKQVKGLMAELSLEAGDISRLWMHQANINMNRYAAKKILGRAPLPEEAPYVLEHYGNTAAAGSVMAFNLYNGDRPPGDIGFLCSFGAGYSIGCIALKKV